MWSASSKESLGFSNECKNIYGQDEQNEIRNEMVQRTAKGHKICIIARFFLKGLCNQSTKKYRVISKNNTNRTLSELDRLGYNCNGFEG